MARNNAIGVWIFITLASKRYSPVAEAFHPLMADRSRRMHPTNSDADSPLTPVQSVDPISSTRHDFLQTILQCSTGALTVAACSLNPSLAHAETTLASQLAVNEALRSVKATQRRFTSTAVRDSISSLDYPAVQAMLREPPISEIRKSCRVLVKAAAAATDADVARLEGEYTLFIQALELLDTTALGAIRGRKVTEADFQGVYDTAVSTLSTFRTTAEQLQQALL